MGANIFRDPFAALRDIVGGQAGAYEKVLKDARDVAIGEMTGNRPAELVDRLLAGESPIRVYRGYRGMTRKQLARAAGIGHPYLSQIETGRYSGSPKTQAAIVTALDEATGEMSLDTSPFDGLRAGFSGTARNEAACRGSQARPSS